SGRRTPRARGCSRRASGSFPWGLPELVGSEGEQQGAEFGGGFREFGLGVGVGHDAAARKQFGGGAVDVGAADGHHPFAVAGGVGVADSPGVEAAVERFEFGDGRIGLVGGIAADRGGGGEGLGQHVDGGARVAQFAGDLGGQVPHGGSGDRLGFVGDIQGAAVGAERFDDGFHDDGVFGSVFGGGEQGSAAFPVPGRVGVAGAGARERAGHHGAAGVGDEQVRAGPDEGARTAVGGRQVGGEGEPAGVGLREVGEYRGDVHVVAAGQAEAAGQDNFAQPGAVWAGQEGDGAFDRGGVCGGVGNGGGGPGAVPGAPRAGGAGAGHDRGAALHGCGDDEASGCGPVEGERSDRDGVPSRLGGGGVQCIGQVVDPGHGGQ